MEIRRRVSRFNPVGAGVRLGRFKAVIALGAVLFVLFLSYAYIIAQLRPALRDTATVRVNALVSDAMYTTVLDMMAGGALDEPFMSVQDSDGQVYYSQLNNRSLTKFASDCANESQVRLISYGKQGVKVPIGTASGVSLFAGAGPNITMKFHPETNTQAYFSSEFTSAGINQTLHRVMLRLEAQVAVVLPGENLMITSYVDVPIAEQIIVGQVPDTYVGIGGDKLNLVP